MFQRWHWEGAFREATSEQPPQVELLPLRYSAVRPCGTTRRNRANGFHRFRREGPGKLSLQVTDWIPDTVKPCSIFKTLYIFGSKSVRMVQYCLFQILILSLLIVDNFLRRKRVLVTRYPQFSFIISISAQDTLHLRSYWTVFHPKISFLGDIKINICLCWSIRDEWGDHRTDKNVFLLNIWATNHQY